MIKAYLWLIAGPIIGLWLCAIAPRSARRWPVLNDVYGNPYDELDGDASYAGKGKWWGRYVWSFIRNPINAYLRSLGPCGIVQDVFEHGDTLYATIEGERYHFTRRHLFGEWYWWNGYKLLNDYRMRERDDIEGEEMSRLEVGYHFDNQKLIPWFKRIK